MKGVWLGSFQSLFKLKILCLVVVFVVVCFSWDGLQYSDVPYSLDFAIASPRVIIGWHNVPIVLFHKEALSENDGMGRGVGGVQ